MPALLHLRQVSALHCRLGGQCCLWRLPACSAVANLPRQQGCGRHSMPAAHAAGISAAAEPSTAQSAAAVASAGPAAPAPPTAAGQAGKANWCRMCAGKLDMQIPEGDDHWRLVCQSCGYIDFVNPKMVVGCIVEHEGRLLLCRRAIEPCRGKWTVPAGFMEMDESTAEGAARETWEEARARVTILAPYCHYDIPRIGQAYLLFRAALAEPFTFGSGPESLEVKLVAPEDIEWAEIAFSSVSLALRAYLADMQNGRQWHSHHAVIDKREGSPPNDPNSYVLRDHHQLPIADKSSL